MDDADRAEIVNQFVNDIALDRTDVGFTSPKPAVIAVCLHCGKPLEEVTDAEQLANARRWCDAKCRDAWERENGEA